MLTEVRNGAVEGGLTLSGCARWVECPAHLDGGWTLGESLRGAGACCWYTGGGKGKCRQLWAGFR